MCRSVDKSGCENSLNLDSTTRFLFVAGLPEDKWLGSRTKIVKPLRFLGGSLPQRKITLPAECFATETRFIFRLEYCRSHTKTKWLSNIPPSR